MTVVLKGTARALARMAVQYGWTDLGAKEGSQVEVWCPCCRARVRAHYDRWRHRSLTRAQHEAGMKAVLDHLDDCPQLNARGFASGTLCPAETTVGTEDGPLYVRCRGTLRARIEPTGAVLRCDHCGTNRPWNGGGRI